LVLYDSANAEVARTRTNAAGLYLFDNRQVALRPSRAYRIRAPALPRGFELTLPTVGSNIERDSDARYESGVASLPATTSFYGSSLLRYDIGVRPQSNVGDRVFDDENGDGIQEPGERGLPSIVVQLTDANGTLIAATTTNADGVYKYEYLCSFERTIFQLLF
jgi:hypothetical protein